MSITPRTLAYVGIGFVAVYLLQKSFKRVPVVTTQKPVTTGVMSSTPDYSDAGYYGAVGAPLSDIDNLGRY